jgi:hypothetical protein
VGGEKKTKEKRKKKREGILYEKRGRGRRKMGKENILGVVKERNK